MTERSLIHVDAMEGMAAPPRKNGELVFEAPWEGRAFSMALALCESGAYRWEEFSHRLAQEIAAHSGDEDHQHVLPVAPDVEASYYEAWLTALESLLLDKGLLSREEMEKRTAEFAVGMYDEH